MNRPDFRRLFAVAAAALAVLSLAACGGHSSRSSDGDGQSSPQGTPDAGTTVSAPTPDLDVSGSWVTYMDESELGITTFKMSSSGALSGNLRTDSGESASISGHLAGKEAEYTMSFHHRTFLASVDFAAAGTTASGTLVDSDGHVHAMKLNR